MITVCTKTSFILKRSCLRILSSFKKMSTSADDVIFEVKGKTGIITLNRPKALNAFNLSMAKKIYPKLIEWESTLSFIIIKGTGEKAFCAGGDIRAVTDAGKKKDPSAAEFFQFEYKVNHLIGSLKIPYIALIHGITMGGGVGLSVHGKFRVATEKTVFAMPETAIGLFPDVGGSYFLPRLPNYLGTFYGLTGYRLTGLDVLKGGIATHFCSFNKFSNLETDLLAITNPNNIVQVLNKFTEESLKNNDKEFTLKPHLNLIEKHFSLNTVEEILESLSKDKTNWAQQQLEILSKMSPSSMKLTLRLLREGAKMPLEECLKMEYRVVLRILNENDFYEGVRALLIDKDNKPNWNPATLNQVTNEKLQTFFDHLSPNEEIQLKPKL